MATSSLRFLLLADDKASAAFDRFSRSVNGANRSVDRNNAALARSGKASAAAQGGILGLTGVITGFGDAATVGSSKSGMFAKALGGINLATGVLEPAMSALIVTAGALASAYTSAAIGLAAYSAALKPALEQVQNGVKAQEQLKTSQQSATVTYKTAVITAQQQYAKAMSQANTVAKQQAARTQLNTALQAAAAAKTKSNTQAQLGYKTALAQLSPAERELAAQTGKTQDAYKAWSRSLERPVFAPLIGGLRLAKPLMRALTPAVESTAGALKFLVDDLQRDISGGGFAKWVRSMRPVIWTTIVTGGHTVINVIKGIGGVLRAFAPEAATVTGGIEKASAAFARWGQTLTEHSGFQSLMSMAKQDGPLLRELFGNLVVILKNVGSNMAAIATPANSKSLLSLLANLSGVLAKLSQNRSLVQFVLYLGLARSTLKQFTPALEATGKAFSVTNGVIRDIGAAGGLGSYLRNLKLVTVAQKIWNGVQAAFNWIMRANPIGLIITAIGLLVVAVIYAYKHFKWFRDFVQAVWKAILIAVKAVVAWFRDTFLPFFTKTIPAAWHALIGWFKTAWNTIKLYAYLVWLKMEYWFLKYLVNPVVSFLAAIPGPWQSTFKKMRDGVHTQMAKVNGDIAATQAKIDGMHGKHLPIWVTGQGSWSVVARAHARGEGPVWGHAKGGLISGGKPGKDSVLAWLMPGEVVVPTRMVAHGVVDHLRGHLPGFAAGGVVRSDHMVKGQYGPGSLPLIAPWLARAYAATAVAIENATAKATYAGMIAAAKKAALGSGSAVFNYAKNFLGLPYLWGGTGPGAYDCSGLTQHVYRHFRYPAPRTSEQQQAWARPSRDQAGALVFFYGRNGTASHVGISSGHGTMINAPHTGAVVSYAGTAGNTGFGIPPGGFAGRGGYGAGTGGASIKEYVRSQAAAGYLWDGPQWVALNKLIARESSWKLHALNAGSGASGLFQDITGTWGKGNLATQTKAGLRYISSRYGNPENAWWHENRYGWYGKGGQVTPYDSGGWLKPGLTLARNSTGRPERVVSPQQERQMRRREITVNIGPVHVTEPADMDLLARRLSFAIRSADFG